MPAINFVKSKTNFVKSLLIKFVKFQFLFRKGHVALDYPSVAKLAFLHGPDPLKKFANFAGAIVNFIMIAAQLGVCCVYFIFISDNIRQVSKIL